MSQNHMAQHGSTILNSRNDSDLIGQNAKREHRRGERDETSGTARLGISTPRKC
ncbi:hypothetical protein [Sporosarcina limicola]|uniref:Uncharacterized protein n=1 Tax=Sporosarcina limicola TaxID=34101 RepID=A0A927R2I7_9BACL|nr:hypothetical protein [Sporosarcina limicola]MBE1553966.1 hypothetical protein [Sporosarcina limicola]